MPSIACMQLVIFFLLTSRCIVAEQWQSRYARVERPRLNVERDTAAPDKQGAILLYPGHERRHGLRARRHRWRSVPWLPHLLKGMPTVIGSVCLPRKAISLHATVVFFFFMRIEVVQSVQKFVWRVLWDKSVAGRQVRKSPFLQTCISKIAIAHSVAMCCGLWDDVRIAENPKVCCWRPYLLHLRTVRSNRQKHCLWRFNSSKR